MSKTQDDMFKEMIPELQSLYEKFYMKMQEAGIEFELNEVKRTEAVQRAYFAQGRNPLALVNSLRKLAGLYPLAKSENKYKVTWTLRSRHFTGRAFDIRLLKYNKPTWDTKWDGNENSIPDYLEAAKIGLAVGLEAGGLWKKPDYPHFQLYDKPE